MGLAPKAKHFDLIEHNSLRNIFLNESFALQLFFSKFQDFAILYDLDFHQVHLVNVYFHKKGHVFIVQLIVCLYAFLLIIFIKKCSLNVYIVSLKD
jgi:hypothetical protein